MTAPLTLIVEGKPLVFDAPVPVGEDVEAGSWYCWEHADGHRGVIWAVADLKPYANDLTYFTARPPVAPESFADGDVAWVRVERRIGTELRGWKSPDDAWVAGESQLRDWIEAGHAFTTPSPRPESLADVLDDANLPDELRARIEKAVGA